ncbi:MAG: hypothetical protein ABSA48_12815 [Terracidiphilus sp.]|jgi:hypothetical protein
MNKSLALFALLGVVIATGAVAPDQQKTIYPDRWLYLDNSSVEVALQSDKDLEVRLGLIRTAAEHGLTAIVLPGMDRLSLASPEYLARLSKVKEVADANHMEIIPEGFGIKYGKPALEIDKNLAEGLLVKDALFVAKGDTARFVADSPTKLVNGGFEEYKGDRFSGFATQDEPGKMTFVDTSVFHSGKASLRIENFGDRKAVRPVITVTPLDAAGLRDPAMEGVAQVAQEIRVKPYRCYRVSAWVKTEDVKPAKLFSIKAYTPDGRDLSLFETLAPSPTSGWRQVTTAFNSWFADRIDLSFGVFRGVKGKVWVDDVEVEEVGLMNVIRRDGAPLTVRDEMTGTVYKEGRDFAAVSDPNLDFRWTHPMPSIRLLPGGRIHDGARLRVSYYHGTTIYADDDPEVPICPSAAKVREIWKQQFPLIEKYLAPKRYFLDIGDEQRAFNRDQSCLRRKKDASAIAGDTTQWLYDQVHAVNPKAQVLVWSDMFDPNHNAVKKYFLVDGSLENTWKYLPKDMGIVCWYFDKRRQSLDFFSGHGFKTFAAAGPDSDALENPKGWMEDMDTTPGATGIMYTTWSNDFKLLAPFGDLVSKRP